jgi:hypothetical protein
MLCSADHYCKLLSACQGHLFMQHANTSLQVLQAGRGQQVLATLTGTRIWVGDSQQSGAIPVRQQRAAYSVMTPNPLPHTWVLRHLCINWAVTSDGDREPPCTAPCTSPTAAAHSSVDLQPGNSSHQQQLQDWTQPMLVDVRLGHVLVQPAVKHAAATATCCRLLHSTTTCMTWI